MRSTTKSVLDFVRQRYSLALTRLKCHERAGCRGTACRQVEHRDVLTTKALLEDLERRALEAFHATTP